MQTVHAVNLLAMNVVMVYTHDAWNAYMLLISL